MPGQEQGAERSDVDDQMNDPGTSEQSPTLNNDSASSNLKMTTAAVLSQVEVLDEPADTPLPSIHAPSIALNKSDNDQDRIGGILKIAEDTDRTTAGRDHERKSRRPGPISEGETPHDLAHQLSPDEGRCRPTTESLEHSSVTSGPMLSEASSMEPDSRLQNILEQFEQSQLKISSQSSPYSTGDVTNVPSSNISPQANDTSHPPRTSSLESTHPAPAIDGADGRTTAPSQSASRTRDTSRSRASNSHPSRTHGFSPTSPQSSSHLHKTLPPAPEPDLPFDFHRFLDQLRHRTADPVAKFLRSFLLEFGKKQWMVHEQVKIISDFLAFITGKMAQCEVWRDVSDAEFENAREGMEKLVMNRLYSQTFSPAIAMPTTQPSTRDKKKASDGQVQVGRHGQHQEDIERDGVLAQKIRIYKWIREEHLDIAPVEESGRRFLFLAQQELLKIKSYRAPRDKIICVLNCCKVIIGFLRNSKGSDTSADSFMPLLIFVVLQASPEHLVSNIQYVLRFRNQDKLAGEAGYYVSSLMGAIQFIESLDRTSLTISDDEFEKNVEAAVSAIAERESRFRGSPSNGSGTSNMIEAQNAIQIPTASIKNSEIVRGLHVRGAEEEAVEHDSDEKAAVSGLLRSIQRPLSNIGRIFSEEASSQFPGTLKGTHAAAAPPETPQRLSPALFQPPRNHYDDEEQSRALQPSSTLPFTAEDAAARQSSAEAAEARKTHRAEHQSVVETLSGMFPNLDRDVIDDVVRMKEGRIESAVDACLALNTGL